MVASPAARWSGQFRPHFQPDTVRTKNSFDNKWPLKVELIVATREIAQEGGGLANESSQWEKLAMAEFGRKVKESEAIRRLSLALQLYAHCARANVQDRH